jgi:prolyl oligopeptidase
MKHFISKSLTLFVFSLSFLISCESNKSIDYHNTKKIPVADSYFGTEVIDNYRWLEDDMSSETENWVTKQNETTFAYLNEISLREQLKNRLTDLWDYEKISSPFKEGKYTYFYKNTGLQNQSVLYRSKLKGEEEVFLDPNLFSKDGTTSLAGVSFSKDGSLVAYSISEGGSDWRKIIVKNVESNQIIEDTLVDVKFSGVSWKANNGFYYSSYDKPDGSELSEKTDQHKLYYHELGTYQSEDKLIYGGNENEKNRYVRGYVTSDNRFFVIFLRNQTTGNKLLIKDLTTNSEFKTIVGDYASNTSLLDNKGTKLFLVTDYKAPNKKIVTVDVSDPSQENWKDFIPESKFVLSASKCGDYLFASYINMITLEN